MTAIRIRDVMIGDGVPRICVPITGNTIDEIRENADAAAASGADMAEFRCDYLDGTEDPGVLTAALQMLRGMLGRMPLLMTFRSASEGGQQELGDDLYAGICSAGIRSGCIDLIDIELARYEKIRGSRGTGQQAAAPGDSAEAALGLIEQAQRAGVRVIMSNHDFKHTPAEQEIIRRLARMDELGADILKIALMPENRLDVLQLIEATVRMSEMTQKPLVTMSMGRLGVISRMTGGFSGSAITFASAGEASAPGQIDAGSMREILELTAPYLLRA